jgi:hypothetical protein
MTALCEWVDGPDGESPRRESRFWNRLITFLYWTTCGEPWGYYFGPPHADTYDPWHFLGSPIRTYLTTVRCRMRGHPAGQVFFNAGGCEPDESCRDCGEGC